MMEGLAGQIFNYLGLAGLLGLIVSWLLNKRKYKSEVDGNNIKNALASDDIVQKIKAEVKAEMEAAQLIKDQNVRLKTELEVEVKSANRNTEALINLSKQVGANEESERQCKAEVKDLKVRLKSLEEGDRARSDDLFAKVIDLFGELKIMIETNKAQGIASDK